MKMFIFIVTRDIMSLSGHLAEEAVVVAPNKTIALRVYLELLKGDPAKKSDLEELKVERIGYTHQYNYPQIIRKFKVGI